MDNSSSRAEAERWLYTANKLLSASDLHGARSFAVRARESDPTFDASELLLAVIDTLLAGENRINGLHDWYSILQILPYTHNIEYIASQYRRLALLLDPHRNPFAFSSHAFTLVHDAWSVLSSPAKKAMYDNELRMVTGPPPTAPPPQPAPVATVQAPNPVPTSNPIPTPNPPLVQRPPQQQRSPARRGPRSKDGKAAAGERRPSPNIATTEPTPQARTSDPVVSETGSSFWTACPYCYVMYEYPELYEDCTLRCQSCRRGFHAVRVRTPPVAGKDSYYCCWGFFPLGFSGDFRHISGTNSKWNPFSAMFACPLRGGGGGGGGASNKGSRRGPWVFHDDEAAAAFIELSDPSDDDSDDADWGARSERAKKRAKNKGKTSGNASGEVRRAFSERTRRGSQSGSGHANLENGVVGDGGSGVPNTVRAELSKKAANSSRRRGAGNLGKLDLNVEFSNEVEEPAPAVRDGNVAGNAEENIEGNAFFEGLDEFLNSLPILNVVADDKKSSHLLINVLDLIAPFNLKNVSLCFNRDLATFL
ncbi:uncharacterized protein LOC129284778 isoform X1 [Prosopis cineraria]|uniref:uncharacterized protein LOC129284778 isoform X1 n=1 Tax=Prosopis cineraria TaxID=364024 RepID=UPI00240EA92A|nr:uncharacterized protein LOC129284778 isoform X1 [Prosopis cineraria]